MTRDIIRQGANIAAFVAVIIMNALANALPLNGQTTGEISDRFPVLLTPAGFTFSIWGVIYLALGAFVVYQALPSQRENPRLRRIGYWFVASSIANITWLLLWHYNQYALSFVAMLALLGSLIAIYIRLDVNIAPASLRERLLVYAPFSLYMGWITAATILNAGVVLYDADLAQNFLGLSEPTWAAIMLSVVIVVTSLLVLTRTDIVYAAVVIWAFIGIMSKHGDVELVANTAAIGIAIIALLSVGRLVVNWRLDHNLVPSRERSA